MEERLTRMVLTAIIIAAPVMGKSNRADNLVSAFFPEKAKAPVLQNFYGLRFVLDAGVAECNTGVDGKLICLTKNGAQIIFEKIQAPPPAHRLLRYNRKNLWLKLYPTLNHYVEENLVVAGSVTILQSGVFFRLNNINWPVLIRSFDVVMNGETVINVTSICDVSLWPAAQETIENIERSLNNAAK